MVRNERRGSGVEGDAVLDDGVEDGGVDDELDGESDGEADEERGAARSGAQPAPTATRVTRTRRTPGNLRVRAMTSTIIVARAHWDPHQYRCR